MPNRIIKDSVFAFFQDDDPLHGRHPSQQRYALEVESV